MRKITGPGKIGQILFDDASQAQRASESGLTMTPVGAMNTAKRLSCKTVMVFNSGATVAYVKFGDKTVTAATGPADGIPVLANEKAILNSGDAEYVIGSTATLFLYTTSEN